MKKYCLILTLLTLLMVSCGKRTDTFAFSGTVIGYCECTMPTASISEKDFGYIVNIDKPDTPTKDRLPSIELSESSEESGLPPELATPEAMVLWQKVQQAGYVDEHFQPLISRPLAAILADSMAKRLGIKNKWKIFGALWNRNNMRGDYNDALSQRQTLAFQDSLKVLFAD